MSDRWEIGIGGKKMKKMVGPTGRFWNFSAVGTGRGIPDSGQLLCLKLQHGQRFSCTVTISRGLTVFVNATAVFASSIFMA